MKESIRRRLERTVERFEEVGALLADPEATAKPGRFKDLSVEYSRLEPVALRFREFGRLEAERVTAAEMASGADAEMRELAEEELRDLDARIATSSSRYARAPAATRPRSSPATSFACIHATPSGRAGASRS